MEGIALMGAAASAGATAAVILGGNVRFGSVASSAARAVFPRASALLSRMGALPIVQATASLPGWGRMARRAREVAARWGIRIDDGRAEALLVVGALTCGLLAALLFWSPIAGLAAVAGIVLLLGAWDARAKAALARELVQEMPAVFRTLSVAMGSGQTLAQAVEYVGAHERGPAAEPFGRLSLRLRCGLGTEEALGLLAEELDAPGVELLATALVVSHRTGSPLRELLARSARLVERQGEFQRLLAVKTAQVRLSVRIVCALPVVLVLLLALISPDFQRGLLTPVGMASVLLALAIDALALLIIRKLMRGVV